MGADTCVVQRSKAISKHYAFIRICDYVFLLRGQKNRRRTKEWQNRCPFAQTSNVFFRSQFTKATGYKQNKCSYQYFRILFFSVLLKTKGFGGLTSTVQIDLEISVPTKLSRAAVLSAIFPQDETPNVGSVFLVKMKQLKTSSELTLLSVSEASVSLLCRHISVQSAPSGCKEDSKGSESRCDVVDNRVPDEAPRYLTLETLLSVKITQIFDSLQKYVRH